jgi:hypothetical protein
LFARMSYRAEKSHAGAEEGAASADDGSRAMDAEPAAEGDARSLAPSTACNGQPPADVRVGPSILEQHLRHLHIVCEELERHRIWPGEPFSIVDEIAQLRPPQT